VNFFDVDGRQYPFQYIEDQANKAMISLRTGCFCNPGIDELNHCLSTEQLATYFTTRENGDYNDFIKHTGKMRGAVRVSIGIPTTISDIEKFILFAKGLLNKSAPKNYY
jgi:selenocysteine lyase/cysteine desulfurase